MKFICKCGKEYKQLTELLGHATSIHSKVEVKTEPVCPTCGQKIIEKEEATNGNRAS